MTTIAIASNEERQSEIAGLAYDYDYDYEWLAENLIDQPWHEIGNCRYPLGATHDFDTMVNQLTAILGDRLRDLVLSHSSRYRCHATLLASASASTLAEAPGSFCSNSNTSSSNSNSDSDSNILKGDLSPAIWANLHEYVSRMGSLYRNVHFHSLEHAAHVTISMNKMISMLIQTEADDVMSMSINDNSGSECQHGHRYRRSMLQHISSGPSGALRSSFSRSAAADDRSTEGCVAVDEATFGISSDPLLRFALVFASLIHDVGHQGVPNATLVEEDDALAIMHNDISVS